MDLLKTPIGRFRVIALVEGLSYLAILFVTMPLKYFLEMPGPNKVIGMAHGVLFILYILMALQLHFLLKWKKRLTFIVLLASIIPFGTFYLERKTLKSYY